MRILILASGSVLRSLCGVAAGSSKASLSAHFARWGNLGELNAVSLKLPTPPKITLRRISIFETTQELNLAWRTITNLGTGLRLPSRKIPVRKL